MLFTSTIVSTLALAGAALAQDYGSGGGSSGGSNGYGSGSGAGAGAGTSAAAGAGTQTASGATSTATGGASSGGSSSGGNMQVVQVGGQGGALTFTPDDITAAPGSMVQFQFNPKNHSVVQSNFAKPCVPIQEAQPNVTGFFSGFMPVAATDSQKPTFTLQVNDTKPVWIYCAQANHCQKGMVMAINAPKTGDKTLDAFKKLAAQASVNKAPGGAGSGGSATTGGAATATGGAGSAGATGSSGSAGTTGGTVASGTSTAPLAVSTGAAPTAHLLSGAAMGGALAAVVAAAL